jgi:hypothetical protein
VLTISSVDLACEQRQAWISFLPLTATRLTNKDQEVISERQGTSACWIRYPTRSTRLSDASHNPSDPQATTVSTVCRKQKFHVHLYPALQASICSIDCEHISSKQPKRDGSVHSRSPSSYRAGDASRRSSYRKPNIREDASRHILSASTWLKQRNGGLSFCRLCLLATT